MRGVVKKLALLTGLLIFAAAATGVYVWRSTDMSGDVPLSTRAPRGDVLLSQFYAPVGKLPDAPGLLIRSEALTGIASLEAAGPSFRIMYSSTDGLDGKRRNAISGALYLPPGEPPVGGWPLLVWSHGTVGIGDRCAPSFAGRGTRDPKYLNPWLDAGYAIAASDYQGLGTPGTHPYMDARVMAFNNLDLVRALKRSDYPLSDAVLVAGQSQGATGAIATASYQADYAANVPIAGVIATGIPHFSLSVIWELMSKTDREAVTSSVPLSLYMLAYAEMLDPAFQLADIVSERARGVVDQIDNTCVFDFIEAAKEAGLSMNSAFTARNDLPLMKVMSRAQVEDLGFKTPLFAGSGTVDQITPFAMQQAFIADACDAGVAITAKTYAGANHNQGLLAATVDAQAFASTVLSGGAPENICKAP